MRTIQQIEVEFSFLHSLSRLNRAHSFSGDNCSNPFCKFYYFFYSWYTALKEGTFMCYKYICISPMAIFDIYSQPIFFSLSILLIPPPCLPINSFICFLHLGKTRFTITRMYGPLLALEEGFGKSQGLFLAIQAKNGLLCLFIFHCKPF